jgi:hypothetical protein
MNRGPIIESGMSFGPYPDGYCVFHIENSKTYQKLGHGIKMAELLLLRFQNDRSPKVWIVEAKSSSPRPEKQPNFGEFIGEIRDKLANALTLGVAACLDRHESADAELPELFKQLNLKTADFKLVLVINGHQDAWCVPVQDALKKALHAAVKTWNLSVNSVTVINEKKAREHGLIV